MRFLHLCMCALLFFIFTVKKSWVNENETITVLSSWRILAFRVHIQAIATVLPLYILGPQHSALRAGRNVFTETEAWGEGVQQIHNTKQKESQEVTAFGLWS